MTCDTTEKSASTIQIDQQHVPLSSYSRHTSSPGIRWWFLLVSVAVLGPLLMLTAHQIVQIQEARQKAIERDLMDRAKAAALAVSSRLQVDIGYLESLAVSDAAMSADFESLHRQAKRTAEIVTGATGIGLINRDFSMQFMSSKPYGTKLPKPPSTTMAETVFATQKPAVSGIFNGPYSGRKVVAIGVPIFSSGVVTHCLFMALQSETWSELLKSQQLPDNWRIGLIDQDGLTIGRNASSEKYVGTPVVKEFLDHIRSGQFGPVSFTVKEGDPSVGYSTRVSGSNWVLATAVPRAVVEAPLRSQLSILIGTAVGMFALMGLLAYFAGQRLENWTKTLLSAVKAIQEGQTARVEPIFIHELDAITKSLIHAHLSKRQVQEALSRQEDQAQQLNKKLSVSSIDGLTGLWQRQGFVDQVNQRLQPNFQDLGLTVSILFMDLDGFKSINDTQGHQSGDKILIDVGRVLRDIAGLSNVVGRWGGDEFVMCVFMPKASQDTGIDDLIVRIQRRIQAIGSNLGCSVGRADWDASIGSLEQLIDRADAAMYAEKTALRRNVAPLRMVRA